MKWQLAKLVKESIKEIDIDEEIDFSDAVKKNPDIRKMSLISVTGKGNLYATERMMKFHLTIKGEMTLACALTLDDVSYPFETTLQPVFIWDLEKYDENSDDYLVKDTIELASIIWQEIFLQIPLRVVKEGAHEELARLGIDILALEELEKETKNKIDPRFAVLEKLKLEE